MIKEYSKLTNREKVNMFIGVSLARIIKGFMYTTGAIVAIKCFLQERKDDILFRIISLCYGCSKHYNGWCYDVVKRRY